jgi:hypothetical protein
VNKERTGVGSSVLVRFGVCLRLDVIDSQSVNNGSDILASVDDLNERYRQLTVDYEKAVHATYIAFAGIGPNALPVALEAFQKALEKEEDIRSRRDEVLNKLLRRPPLR